MLTVGLDVHKHFTYACAIDAEGRPLWSDRFASTPEAIQNFAVRRLTKDCQLALEATTNCLAFAKLLREYAGRVVISNPMQTKAIAHARVKTDKVDAEVLAQLLRTDFLPTVWEPDEHTQLLRRRVAHRQALMSMRIQTKNRIHSILHRNLITKGEFSDLFGKKGRAFLEQLCANGLPEDDAWQLDHELKMLDSIDRQLAATEDFLAGQAAESPQARLLLTMPGIQFKTAVGLLSAIGPIDRFPSPKKLVSYFGLNPRVRQSGLGAAWTGSISKQGRCHARWLIIEAAQTTVRCPGPLQSFYVQLRKKKGHNVALVAAARKMICIIWHILRTGEPYRWSPPLLTHEKMRTLEIRAGAPKQLSGKRRGEPSKGGKATYRAKRQVDWDVAKLAQQQYLELVKGWQTRNPKRESAGLPSGLEAEGPKVSQPKRASRPPKGGTPVPD